MSIKTEFLYAKFQRHSAELRAVEDDGQLNTTVFRFESNDSVLTSRVGINFRFGGFPRGADGCEILIVPQITCKTSRAPASAGAFSLHARACRAGGSPGSATVARAVQRRRCSSVSQSAATAYLR